MRRRSASSGPGSLGGLSSESMVVMRPSSSATLAESTSTSSAKAEDPAAAISGALPNHRTMRGLMASRLMTLLLLRRRLGDRVLVAHHGGSEIDCRPILRIGGHRVALLEPNHLQLTLLD